MKDASVRRLSSLHTALYRLTGGRVGRRLVDNDMLLLTTIGASTGQDHTVPLLYLEHEGALVVVASYGGRADHPQWHKNLLADPRARAQIGNESFPVDSRMASPEERSILWPRVVDAYDGYEVYQSRTDRVIPLVLLRRPLNVALREEDDVPLGQHRLHGAAGCGCGDTCGEVLQVGAVQRLGQARRKKKEGAEVT